MSAPFVVVGSGPAGVGAVQAFRERDADTPVVLLSADPEPPYARPPLTKDYLRGESTREELWLVEPGWFADHGVELRSGTRVEAVDVERRRLRLTGGEELGYADLVLATGSAPTPLPIPGGDDPDLIYVRDLASGDRLRALAEGPGLRVAVIGSGFIGCEVAASLAARGRSVVLISGDALPHAERLGHEAGERIAGWLLADGVELRTGAPVSRIGRAGTGWRLELAEGSEVRADHVVAGSGAAPDPHLAEKAGIAVAHGLVPTDSGLRTSAPHVFAAGDLARAFHEAAGRGLAIQHWGDAETQGRIAGANAAGGGDRWTSAPGFWSGIGSRTLKYSAWGDGHDETRLVGDHSSWSIWYRSGDALSGVLTFERDDAYERGQRGLEQGASFTESLQAEKRAAENTSDHHESDHHREPTSEEPET